MQLPKRTYHRHQAADRARALVASAAAADGKENAASEIEHGFDHAPGSGDEDESKSDASGEEGQQRASSA